MAQNWTIRVCRVTNALSQFIGLTAFNPNAWQLVDTAAPPP